MNLEDIFSPGGLLDSVLDNYSFRESQLEMSKLIEEGFDTKRNIVIEAGTGIGKSFAYLVPSFLLLMRDKSKKVVIATSTTTLQKQLYDKDIPLIEKALGCDLKTSILYGRGNYLCLRKYMDVFEERTIITLDEDSREAIFDKWVHTTGTGAIQDAPQNIVYLFRGLTSDSHDCIGRLCPYRDKCFFYNARRKAQSSNLVVTNHHIVLFDARIRYEEGESFEQECILPGYTNLVIDEAHHIHDEATEILSDQFSTEQTNFILDELTKKRKRKVKDSNNGEDNIQKISLLESVEQFQKKDSDKLRVKINNEIAHIRTLLDNFDQMLSEILSHYYKDYQILFTKEFYDKFRSKLIFAESLALEIFNLAKDLNDIYDEEASDPILDIVIRYKNELATISDNLRAWIRMNDFNSYIPYAEENKRSGKYTIKIAPMSTGPILYKTLVSNMESMLYCSATLSVGSSFNYFSKDSGFKEDPMHLEGIYTSPFDYGSALMLLVPQDGMEFSNSRRIEYNQYASNATAKALEYSSGGALVLFTAKDMLKEVCASVREKLGKDYKILSQGDEGAHKAKLLEEFRSEEDTSLFATDSFWEGVDAPGNTLRLVVIEKLPFHVPTNPIDMARSNYIESQNNGSSFAELSIPRACIKLKQGIGRLIRSEDDKGVVLILDKRIISKGYGRVMLRSLPHGYFPEDTLLDNIENKIERFLF